MAAKRHQSRVDGFSTFILRAGSVPEAVYKELLHPPVPVSFSKATDPYLGVLTKCGGFQWLVAILAFLTKMIGTMSVYFMAYGAYNPGWRCAGNDAQHETVWLKSNQLCELVDTCQNVHFNPEAETIVTQFNLICGRGWIMSVILSIQMAGILFGTLLVGFLEDRLGRKLTLQVGMLLLFIVCGVSIVGQKLEIFAVLRFFVGFFYSILANCSVVLVTEFVPESWRTLVGSAPVWNTGQLVLCFAALITHNWISIHFIITVMAAMSFVSLFIIPESLRWLLAQGFQDHSFKVVKRISSMNHLQLPPRVPPNSVANSTTRFSQSMTTDQGDRKSSVRDLFRVKFTATAILGFCFFTLDMAYFAINFSVAYFPGNIYVNMITLVVTEFPSNLLSSFLPDLAGRKLTCGLSFAVSGLCVLCAGVVNLLIWDDEAVRTSLTLMLTCMAKVFTNICWYTLLVLAINSYPTLYRTTATGYLGLMSGIGSIVAPFLLPPILGSLHVPMFIMAGCFCLCSCLVSFAIVETKTKCLTYNLVESETKVNANRMTKQKLQSSSAFHAKRNTNPLLENETAV